VDLFYSFRWILSWMLGAYFALTIAVVIGRVAGALRRPGRTYDFARLSASYALVSFRLWPLRFEIVEIVLWLALLVLAWRAHAWIA